VKETRRLDLKWEGGERTRQVSTDRAQKTQKCKKIEIQRVNDEPQSPTT